MSLAWPEIIEGVTKANRAFFLSLEAATEEGQSTLQTLLGTETSSRIAADALKAPINSPAFTGTPTAPTPLTSDSSTRIATTQLLHELLAGGGLTEGAADAKYALRHEKRKAYAVKANTVLATYAEATIHDCTIEAATPTLTLPELEPGDAIVVKANQDASGNRQVVWAAHSGQTLVWTERTIPVLVGTPSIKDVLIFFCLAPNEIIGALVEPNVG